MILSRWIERDLTEFELTESRRGDMKRLAELLVRARGQYEKSLADISPFVQKLDSGRVEDEEKLLELGMLDTVRTLAVDVRFNLAWANLYLGLVDPKNPEQRGKALANAERGFRELLDAGQDGESAARCKFGLGVALRELKKFDEAYRSFDEAERDAGAALKAQIVYTRGRTLIGQEKFDEGRAILKPMAEIDADSLPEKEKPARFYYSLARLWEANSFLLEGEKKKTDIATSAKLREAGVNRMNRLMNRGGPWPAVVAAFLPPSATLDADVRTLTPGELLLAARQLVEQKKHRQALLRLNEIVGRSQVAADTRADALMLVGECEYESGNLAAAADAFEKLATEAAKNAQAPKAIDIAYQLRAKAAEESKKSEDYVKLAQTLQKLVTNFPQHPKRAEAIWWLPVAHQAAGNYESAIQTFANVPKNSAHYVEAQFRRLMCKRLQLESKRATLAAADFKKNAAALAKELSEFADATTKAPSAAPEADVKKWLPTAVVTAAELRSLPGVDDFSGALDALRDFETRFKGSELVGRALAVRIAAHRALKQFDEAAKVVEQYLQTVPAGQAGGVLATMAAGMQEEVERLQKEGRADDAKKLAGESIQTFEQLDLWVRADASRAGYVDGVTYGLARMRLTAGDLSRARELADLLVKRDASNGLYRLLLARILTGELGDSPKPPDPAISNTRAAWEALLRDTNLRNTAPETYWEARYEFLRMLLLEGRASEVEAAIRQEKLWSADFGGSRKREFDLLYKKAGGKSGGTASELNPSKP